ncbi:hypothetical protein ACH4C2_12480 [Streptomyces sp. NPDC018057]|uniref:hypothetical protein n=1 Tax=unclassified Streptomyces TaxID=2593676 RepID=UPI0037B6439D
MDTTANLLCVALPLLPVLWLWGRPLFTGRWRSAGWFTGTAVLCAAATSVVWLTGALAGTSLDAEEACHRDGAVYDRAYRAAHAREDERWFPLHDRCSAAHDLVPVWVDPALVLLPAAALACLGAAVGVTVRTRRTGPPAPGRPRPEKPRPEKSRPEKS